jgi:hypothetical protein
VVKSPPSPSRKTLAANCKKKMTRQIIFCFTILTLSCNSGQQTKRQQSPEKISIKLYQYKCIELTQLQADSTVLQVDTNFFSFANRLITYIDSLKLELLSKAKQIDPNEIELNKSSDWDKQLQNIDSLYSYKTSTNILIGDPTNPKTGKWSATELQLKISEFKTMVSEKDCFKPVYNSLATENSFLQDGVKVDWWIIHFYYMPLIESLKILTDQQIEIKRITLGLLKERQHNKGFTE